MTSEYLAIDLPDGLIFRNRVKVIQEKYFSFSETKISRIVRSIRTRQEGRFAIVTSVGYRMRWTLGPCRTSKAKADGEIVWSRSPDAGIKFVDDDRRAMVANKPGTPGRARISR